MQYQIEELGLGGILDQTIKLVKNHFRLLFGIVAVCYLPWLLMSGFVTLALLPEMPMFPSQQETQAYQVAAAQASLYTLPLTLPYLLVVLPLTNAAVIDAVSRCYLSKKATIGGSYSYAFRILLPLLGTWLLATLAVSVGLLFLIIPGIIFWFWFLFSTHAVVVGGESGRAALSRSKKLIRGNIGTAILLCFVLGIIQGGITLGAVLIPQPHVATAARACLGSVAFIFSTVAFVVFYFSCRCENENFDLTILAENIGLTGPAEPEAAG